MIKTEPQKIQSASYGDVENIGLRIDNKNFVHIFNILSNSLYSDKIAAVIREIICNARDANVESKSDRPIEITSPRGFHSYFTVRDFGNGLSESEIKTVFASVGESTKQTSNDSVGFFGIGSKSPFAYTDSYLIESIHNGYLNVYNNLKTEDGPIIHKMGRPVKTDEPSGIKITVKIRPDDMIDFNQKLKSFLNFFDQAYILDGGDVTLPSEVGETILELKDIGVRLFQERCGRRSSGLLMGGVVYNIDLRNFGFKNSHNDTIISVPIGSVSVPPSRELIEYNNKNSVYIKGIIDEIHKHFDNYVCNITFGDMEKTRREYSRYCDFCRAIGIEVKKIKTPYKYATLEEERKIIDGVEVVTKSEIEHNYYIDEYIRYYDNFSIQKVTPASVKRLEFYFKPVYYFLGLHNLNPTVYYVDTESNFKARLRNYLSNIDSYIYVIDKKQLDKLKCLDFPLPKIINISELPISCGKEKTKRIIDKYYYVCKKSNSLFLDKIENHQINKDDIIYVVKCHRKDELKNKHSTLFNCISDRSDKRHLVFCKYKFVDQFKKDFPSNEIVFVEDVRNKIDKASKDFDVCFLDILNFIESPPITESYSSNVIKFLFSNDSEIKKIIREYSKSKILCKKILNLFSENEKVILNVIIKNFWCMNTEKKYSLCFYSDIYNKITNTLKTKYKIQITKYNHAIYINLYDTGTINKFLKNIHTLVQ